MDSFEERGVSNGGAGLGSWSEARSALCGIVVVVVVSFVVLSGLFRGSNNRRLGGLFGLRGSGAGETRQT